MFFLTWNMLKVIKLTSQNLWKIIVVIEKISFRQFVSENFPVCFVRKMLIGHKVYPFRLQFLKTFSQNSLGHHQGYKEDLLLLRIYFKSCNLN